MKRRPKNDGFLRFGFGKKPKLPPSGAKPVPAVDERAKNDDFRFLMKQLSFQSKYVSGLTNVHNKLLSRPLFHERKLRQAKGAGVDIPVITGVVSEDARLMLNSRKMRLLEEEINNTRLDGVRAFKRNGFAAAEVHLDKARDLEKDFNDLKEKNLLIFIKRFGKNNS